MIKSINMHRTAISKTSDEAHMHASTTPNLKSQMINYRNKYLTTRSFCLNASETSAHYGISVQLIANLSFIGHQSGKLRLQFVLVLSDTSDHV